jgi:hypothetical protein
MGLSGGLTFAPIKVIVGVGSQVKLVEEREEASDTRRPKASAITATATVVQSSKLEAWAARVLRSGGVHQVRWGRVVRRRAAAPESLHQAGGGCEGGQAQGVAADKSREETPNGRTGRPPL